MLQLCSSLIAETHMAEVSARYREAVAANATSGFWYLLVPFFTTALALVIYKIVDRPPAVVNVPNGLLSEICRTHRINASGRNLLNWIAEESELIHPATMLLGPAQFEAAVKRAGVHIEYDRRQLATLSVLRRRLFA